MFTEALTDRRIRIASDGSGGRFAADHRLARVGWGAAAVRFRTDDINCNDVVEVAGICGGIWHEQTVPRAEVAGLTAALQLIRQAGNITIAIDNAGALAQLRNVVLARASTASEIWSLA